jgi:hypothetical protein
MQLQHVGAKGNRRQPRKRRPGMVRQSCRTPEKLTQLHKHVQPDLLQRRRVEACALEYSKWQRRRPNSRDGGGELIHPAHPGANQKRLPGLDHGVEQPFAPDLSRRDFPGGSAKAAQELDCLDRKRGREKDKPALAAMASEFCPFLPGKFHPPPVVEAASVLAGKCDAKRLVERGFRVGNVGLEFYRVGAPLRRGVYVSMRTRYVTIVRLRNLRDQKAAGAGPDRTSIDFQFAHRRKLTSKNIRQSSGCAGHKPCGIPF